MKSEQHQHAYAINPPGKSQATTFRSLGAALFILFCSPLSTLQAWEGPDYRCSDGTHLESAHCAPSDDWKNMFDGRTLSGWTQRAMESEKREMPMPFNVGYPNTRWAKIRLQNHGQPDHGYQNLEHNHDFDDYCGEFEFITRVYGAPGQRGGTGIQFASHWNKAMNWYSGPQVDVELGPTRKYWKGFWPFVIGDFGEFGFWRTGFIYDEYTNSVHANAWDGNDSTWAYPNVNYGADSYKINRSDVNNLAGPWNYVSNGIEGYHPMRRSGGTGEWFTLYMKWENLGNGQNAITTIVDGKVITNREPILMGEDQETQHGGRWGKIALQVHRQLPFNDETLDVHYKGLYFKTPGTTNVAKNKRAYQRTTAYGGVAQRAVDGMTTGDYRQNSVTHTSRQDNPWWAVDLGSAHDLEGITVWNRSDCCTDRLKTFQVKFRDANNQIMEVRNVTWPTGLNSDDPNYNPRSVYVPFEKEGVHRVMIQAFGKNRILSLAEVQVWGRESNAQRVCPRPSDMINDSIEPPY